MECFLLKDLIRTWSLFSGMTLSSLDVKFPTVLIWFVFFRRFFITLVNYIFFSDLSSGDSVLKFLLFECEFLLLEWQFWLLEQFLLLESTFLSDWTISKCWAYLASSLFIYYLSETLLLFFDKLLIDLFTWLFTCEKFEYPY